MSRFDDMVNGLRDEMDIPESVWRGYVQTLEDLPERGGYHNKDNGRISGSKNKNGGRGSDGMGSRNSNRRDGGRRKAAGGISVLKAAAFILVSVTLLGTSAYAVGKHFGILDFLRGGNENAVPPVEAEDLIVPVTEQEQEKKEITDGMLADYTVKEAMCDSESIYVVIEAKAKEEGRYFFVPEDAMLEDPVRDWGLDSDLSAGEYAASKNLEIKHVNAAIQNTDELGIAVSTIYFQYVSDDVMDIMVECGKTVKEQTLDVVCTGILWDETMTDMEDIMRTEIRFTLTDISNSVAAAYAPSGAAQIPGTEAVIESAQVTQTELGTYLEILFKYNSEDWSKMPCFRLAGAGAGEEHRIRMASGTEILNENENLWKLSLTKMELGDRIELEAYNAETKEVYGTFELVRQG